LENQVDVAEANFCGVSSGDVYVDSMLGWLARWLRMLGVEAHYDASYDDDFLARVPGLVITRDEQLYRARRGSAILLITDDHLVWLAVMSRALGIDLRIEFGKSLCPICGGHLTRIGRRDVESLLPAKVVEQHDEFLKCINCGKLYWVGNHHRKMQDILIRAMELSKRINSICMDGSTIFKIQ